MSISDGLQQIMLNAQLCLQPQFVPQREHNLSQLSTIFARLQPKSHGANKYRI